jgi:hypothetical protein
VPLLSSSLSTLPLSFPYHFNPHIHSPFLINRYFPIKYPLSYYP